MAKPAWDPKLAVGVASIDKQHQELFRQVGLLLEAMEASKAKAEVTKILAFLGKYVVDHFAGEELLMSSYRYPQAADHKAQHAAFVKVFGELKAELEQFGASVGLAIKLQRTVLGWLVQHIGSTDLALARFIKAKDETKAA
jgi:hemerythrin